MDSHAVYSRLTLSLYDWLVLGFSNRYVWRCPTRRLIELYRENLSGNHLELGVGTGYLLERCGSRSYDSLALVDRNPASLQVAGRSLRSAAPALYRRNVLQPLRLGERSFTSVGMNYLLHCLPGGMSRKAAVFDHVNSYLSPGGVVFGATMLSGGVEQTGLSSAVMKLYNAAGIFSNSGDTPTALRRELAERYRSSRVDRKSVV